MRLWAYPNFIRKKFASGISIMIFFSSEPGRENYKYWKQYILRPPQWTYALGFDETISMATSTQLIHLIKDSICLSLAV